MKTLKLGLAVTVVTFFVATVFVSAGTLARGEDQLDAAAFYKAKCVACHGQKAEKKFDSSLPDDQLVDIVIKGKKSEKPPNMPAYGEKGVNAEQGKTLVDYMKSLKSAP